MKTGDLGGLSREREIVIDLIKKYNIVGIGQPVKLSSGRYSDVYVDMRKAAGVPGLFHHIINLVANKLNKPENKQLIGLELFGAIYAHSIGEKIGVTCATLRKEIKDHGTEKRLEGYIEPGIESNDILLIDDVLTTGTSIINGAYLLKPLRYDIKRAFVLVDRQEGGREILKSNYGIEVESLFTLENLLK